MLRVDVILYRKTEKVEKKWSYRDENIVEQNGE